MTGPSGAKTGTASPPPIAVPHAGERDPQQLAAAQLCHQSLAWDARTRHPSPLHLAGAMDRFLPAGSDAYVQAA
ncbi:RNaseH domain-containing protein [Streptomyces sp. NPDC048248]|uniref:RNaseH domain-containing protein n=1 Tax=Streptomyces sp. NPDC048248 TaxID=3365523 RepID=UPI003723CE2E